MWRSTRRGFLKGGLATAVAASTNVTFSRFLAAQRPSSLSTIFIDPRRSVAPLDRNVLGSFLEQLGRAIYEGIYDPGSKFADSNGFRKDVMTEISKLGVPIIRYPGELRFWLQLARRRWPQEGPSSRA